MEITSVTYQYAAAYRYSFTEKFDGFVEMYDDLPEKKQPIIIGMLA